MCATAVVEQRLCDHLPAVRRNNENSLLALFGMEVNVPMRAVKNKNKKKNGCFSGHLWEYG